MQNNLSAPDEGTKKLRGLALGVSFSLLLIHGYARCYPAFFQWQLTSSLTDRLVHNFLRISWIGNYWLVKLAALACLVLATIGTRAKDHETITFQKPLVLVTTGSAIYFFSYIVLNQMPGTMTGYNVYLSATLVGYLMIFAGFSMIARWIAGKWTTRDIFNSLNETFPQEERLIDNEYSINLPAVYNLRGIKRQSWINIINPFRGLLIMGTPGSGKTFFIIRQIIRQHIQKGFAMFIYDFKYPDLTNVAYHHFRENLDQYPVKPEFYVIDFEQITHRCNPLNVESMKDVTDAAESARTILLGLNPVWIKKQGDFWVESSINFLTALLWWLRLYEKGKYCTLAHVVELIQTPYDKLFTMLRAEPQVEALILPFVTAYINNASAQLEGQIAGTTISLGKLASPALYYVLSGNDLTLDINDPQKPKIVCVGNRPQKAGIYGAVLSLYFTELTRQLNKKNRMKSSLILDELPSIYCHGIDHLIATARSNRVATTLAVQDASQLKLHYGREQAEVIMNIVGNIISGQVSGDTARQLADRFGRILQDKQSVSVHRNSNSVTSSMQLDMAIPQSTIAALSAGEFVGMVADDPDQPIRLKKFHCAISRKALPKKETFGDLTELPRAAVDQKTILENYLLIKKDVCHIIDSEMDRILNDPELRGLIIQKKDTK